jgi:hypothetical protein
MAKKDFKSGLDGLIHSSFPPKQKTTDKEKKASSEMIKATYLFESELLEDIKAIAYYNRKSIGQVLAEAMEQYIKNFPKLKEAQTLFTNK